MAEHRKGVQQAAKEGKAREMWILGPEPASAKSLAAYRSMESGINLDNMIDCR